MNPSDTQYVRKLFSPLAARSSASYVKHLNAVVRVTEKRLREAIEDPRGTYARLAIEYPNVNSRASVVTAVLSVFRHDPELCTALPDAHLAWRERLDNLRAVQRIRRTASEPNAKQLASYVSFADIRDKCEQLRRSGPHATRKDSTAFLLLSFYSHQLPKRADLGALKVYNDADPNADGNYVVLRAVGGRHASTLVMNDYKTAKSYGRYEEELHPRFVEDLRASLRHHPRSHVWVDRTGKAFASNDSFGTYVTNTFRNIFGVENCGAGMLRHAYISELDFNSMTEAKRAAIARGMLHTPEEQMSTYRWVKNRVGPTRVAI